MEKFLIFALLGLSVGLGKSIPVDEEEGLDQEDVEDELQEIFNLTPDVLKEECNVDFESEWPKIGAAIEKLLQYSYDFDEEARAHFTDEDSIFGERVLIDCRKNEPLKNARINVIKTALPCAQDDRVSELVKVSEMNTC